MCRANVWSSRAQAIEEGLEGVARVEQRHISVEEVKRSAIEVFLAGSSLPVMPVVQVGGSAGCGGCV